MHPSDIDRAELDLARRDHAAEIERLERVIEEQEKQIRDLQNRYWDAIEYAERRSLQE